jgi:hypothetical protein
VPDWSYRTVLRPALFGLPGDAAHRLVLGVLRGMTALPGGYRVVDFMGHMAAPPGASIELDRLRFSSPVGLAAPLDPRGRAHQAFARFGPGWLSVGPVGGQADPAAALVRDDPSGGLAKHRPGAAILGLDETRRLAPPRPGPCPVLVELTSTSRSTTAAVEELGGLLSPLADVATGFVVSAERADLWSRAAPADRRAAIEALVARSRALHRPLLIGLPVRPQPEPSVLADLAAAGATGVYLAGEVVNQTYRWGPDQHDDALAATRGARQALGPGAWVVTDAGVESPRQAVTALEAGADLVAVSSGLVYTGPALIKRANEAIAAIARPQPAPNPDLPAERTSWFWAIVLGAGMAAGALLAAWIALTTVLMPYDEEFLGASRDEIAAFNPRILDFMTHDRITLAGTMLTIALLYVALGLFGIRRGHHWAQRSVVYSALFGFFTFFAFIGFGYLDPLHAFVTAVLCQLFLLVVVLPIPERRRGAVLDLDNDAVWRRMQWGQLLFVVHAVGLLVAGSLIMAIGMTNVFVPQDLGFLGMSPEEISSFGLELVPLIAHDRASFGGMLIASGLAILLSTLWGFRRGDRWQWWAFLLAAIPPYAATLWIHLDIGYIDHLHLSPVYIGAGLVVLGLAVSRGFLCARGPGR